MSKADLDELLRLSEEITKKGAEAAFLAHILKQVARIAEAVEKLAEQPKFK